MTLNIDIETYSSIDLKSAGVYKYVEAEDFTILCISYSVDGGDVVTIDTVRRVPECGDPFDYEEWVDQLQDFKKLLTEPSITKKAWNANFERTCLAKYFGVELPPEQWECTMVKAAMLGLPLSLETAAKVLKLAEQKDAKGKTLLNYFSKPCKPSKANGGRTRNLPHHAPDKWQQLLDYCAQDVRTEMAVGSKIAFFEIPAEEKRLWCLDQRMNDRGIGIDRVLVEAAIGISDTNTLRLIDEAVSITGIDNPNSAAQLKKWLSAGMGEEVTSLTKANIPELLKLVQIEDYPIKTESRNNQNPVKPEFKNEEEKIQFLLANKWSPMFTGDYSRWIYEPDAIKGLDLNQHNYTTESALRVMFPKPMKAATNEGIKRVLEIRQELSKTSVKKYQAMLNGLCEDSRVRGLLQFYGANRTGRWAGRLVQVQNLPQNKMPDLGLAREITRRGDCDDVTMLYGNVPNVLSQLVRTAFVASENSRFLVADFSAIEARVIAWFAKEKWRLDVFATHGKIYEASASQMFKVPLEEIGKGNPLRQKGKVAELALGYQGGANALITMGALNQGLKEEELPEIVRLWREASPNIVRLWYAVDKAAKDCLMTGEPQSVNRGVRFAFERGILFIHLPSGRKLSYLAPRLAPGKFGEVLTYEGMDQTTKQWKRQDTYGGKLVENIVQAIARDCLAVAMLRLEDAGYKLVMSVHDEVVIDAPNSFGSLEEINEIMSRPVEWAKDLPLRAESYETLFYKKD